MIERESPADCLMKVLNHDPTSVFTATTTTPPPSFNTTGNITTAMLQLLLLLLLMFIQTAFTILSKVS